MYTLKDVLALYLSKNKYIEYRIKSQEAITAWNKVCDSYIKMHTSAIYVKNGTLFVSADSSVISNELSLKENEFVKRINDQIGTPVISRIKMLSGFVKGDEISLKTINNIDRIVDSIKEDELRFIMKKYLITLSQRTGSK
jgi:predicted nucleic acid-binding Zn ribbon protein